MARIVFRRGLLLAPNGPLNMSAFPPLVGAKRTSISACDRLDYEYGSYTIKSLFSIPNITPPQLLPTYSY